MKNRSSEYGREVSVGEVNILFEQSVENFKVLYSNVEDESCSNDSDGGAAKDDLKESNDEGSGKKFVIIFIFGWVV